MTNIERWNFYLQDVESPQTFIDWTYYYTIGAALERRVWYGEKEYPVFPNMFVVFIGPPGVGKTSASKEAKKIFQRMDTVDSDGKLKEKVCKGPDSITLRALTMYLAKNVKKFVVEEGPGKGKVTAYSSIAFFASGELGNLFSKEAKELVRFLCAAWDCEDYQHETAHSGSDMIKNMSISLLGSGTPDWIRSSMADDVFNEGMAARAIFVWGGAKRHLKFSYSISDEQRKELKHVEDHIRSLTDLYGQVVIEPETEQWLQEWYEKGGCEPIIKDRKLLDYYGRKKVHLLKLAMCMKFGESIDDLILTIEDFQRALEFLNNTERLMSMALQGVGKNDLSKVTQMVMEHLQAKPDEWVKKKALQGTFWNDLPQGAKSLEVVLEHLQAIGKIKKAATCDEWMFKSPVSERFSAKPTHKTLTDADKKNRPKPVKAKQITEPLEIKEPKPVKTVTSPKQLIQRLDIINLEDE